MTGDWFKITIDHFHSSSADQENTSMDCSQISSAIGKKTRKRKTDGERVYAW